MFAGVYNLQMYLFTIRARYDLAMTLQSKVMMAVRATFWAGPSLRGAHGTLRPIYNHEYP